MANRIGGFDSAEPRANGPVCYIDSAWHDYAANKRHAMSLWLDVHFVLMQLYMKMHSKPNGGFVIQQDDMFRKHTMQNKVINKSNIMLLRFGISKLCNSHQYPSVKE